MSTKTLELKIATPYARALYEYSVDKNIMHKITGDFQNLEIFLNKTDELITYLNNPVVRNEDKRDILTNLLKSQVNEETFKFLLVLVDRDRINLLQSIIDNYLKLVYGLASIKMIEVSTAFPFTNKQKNMLIKKLKDLTNAREIRLIITVDSDLIGGFLIQTNSKVLDFTVKNQLQKLANHLDTSLEI
jgi:F-type H+-transporting ATPase subunit delta